MNRLFHILYLTLALVLFSGCRCVRHTSSTLDRTDTAAIDVRFRSLSQLRDTCAERQTIRIEYYHPNLNVPDIYWNGAFATADTTDTASIVGSVPPCNTGGGVPAIKSIEIVTERNAGSSQTSTTDSTKVSHTSTKETQQEKAASEARQDNGTVSIVSVVAALAMLAFALIVLKRSFK